MMFGIAFKMLMGDRVKFIGLLFGITFTSFLVTFAASYFCGFMTRGFSLISETPADIWVMAPSVSSTEQTVNMPNNILNRVRGIRGVLSAVPLLLGSADVRFPNGRVQPFQVIGVDDASLTGIPAPRNAFSPSLLRLSDSVIVDGGGTDGKLETPIFPSDQWPYDGPHLTSPTRPISVGDELLVNDNRIKVVALGRALPRFPPHPLMYMTISNADRILFPERQRLTFVLVKAKAEENIEELATNIQKQTGFRARTADDFKADTIQWFLINSEDVGDMAAMLVLAMSVGFGVTGVMLYMFTYENLKQYAVLKALGAKPRMLIQMVLVQAITCAAIGTGIGLGICALIGESAAYTVGYPFRMMWFTLVFGVLMVLLVSLVSALISVRPVLRLQPATVFMR